MKYVYIKNKEEFEEKYPYQKQYIKKYPNTYPCILEMEYHEGGFNS